MRRFLRFLTNGVFATVVHFLVLLFCMEALQFRNAATAGLIASAIGISCSFVGNKHFVFPDAKLASPRRQFVRFLGLYGIVGALHALVLLVWSDIGGLDYRIGFAIATALQLTLTFLGNKRWVFR